ncbi:vitamin-D-receptor interacting mediator subunit 4 domain-containing protein [Ditylenchus destructor]|uniref:Mediator of RNA polymerase II transcription subunit 4 n=1 Tax=Ditylenchus destructor TaxID=166010 RepID=A0AAD4MYA1_9BILA|nr:vitamin-D-receptor interacting mediator subunit 4 domain-containing protein [Ditylenchus destructor]
MDNRSPKEQLSECVDDFETISKKILEKLLLEKRQLMHQGGDKSAASETIAGLAELFQQKATDFNRYLKTVPNHQEREEYIRTLEKTVDTKDSVIRKLASELKYVELSLQEATYQAEKKLKSIRESETNRAFSEDVIRLAHQISKSHSVASSLFWQQGDPGRPFPIESDFAQSALQLSRTVPQPQHPFNRQSSTGAIGLTRSGSSTGLGGHLRGSPMMNPAMNPGFGPVPGGKYTPSPRQGIFGQAGPISGSPRGRPPGSGMNSAQGARLPSPSTRGMHPHILQRRPSQSPRSAAGSNMMTGATTSPYMSMPNMQSALMQQQQRAQNERQNSVGDLEKVEQMSSADSSSSSSSDDDASPGNM